MSSLFDRFLKLKTPFDDLIRMTEKVLIRELEAERRALIRRQQTIKHEINKLKEK